MKNTSITIPKIKQKIEVIEIQMKLLFDSYKDLVSKFLYWKLHKEDSNYSKESLTKQYANIMNTLNTYVDELDVCVNHIGEIVKQTRESNSISIFKSLEHQLYEIENIFAKCNTYTYIIDSSKDDIEKLLNYKSTKNRRVLN